MKTCNICEASGVEVRLFDGIYNGQMAVLCERCSIVENIPIIKKPGTNQLKESEQIINVYDRMKRLSGIEDKKEDETFFREDKLNELDNNPELEMPEVEKLNLLENFHWGIMKSRRRKGLTQQQLAESLGESETSIQMVEKGKLPENAEILIKKLEQLFQIKLKKTSESDLIKQEPSLLDEEGNELEIIPEEEIESYISEEQDQKEDHEKVQKESLDISNEFITEEGIKDLNIKTDAHRVTIGDLQKIHKKKLEVTKEEQINK